MLSQNFLDLFTSRPGSIESILFFIIILALLMIVPIAGIIISLIIFIGILTVENFLVISGSIDKDIHISFLMLLLIGFSFFYLYLMRKFEHRPIQALFIIQALVYLLPLILLIINSITIYIGPRTQDYYFQLVAGVIILIFLLLIPIVGAGISIASFIATLYVIVEKADEFSLKNVELYSIFLVVLVILAVGYALIVLPKKKIIIIQIVCYCLPIFPLSYLLFNDYWISGAMLGSIILIIVLSLIINRYSATFKKLTARLKLRKPQELKQEDS
ncbi:MAG: hypothetical protein ACTSQS_06965 [Promethearchaeota archaeon]